VLLLVGIFFFAYQRTTIPDPNEAYQAQASYVYYDGGRTKIGTFATQNRESIPLSEVPQSMQDAIVAAEDRTFWTNKGIDPKGIVRAAFSNAKGNATQGASTITQQYVKLLYLNQQRTFKRKIKEAFLSLKIQQKQSKQEILAGYLNTVYFGRGAYGVQAASQAWFHQDAKKLNPAQSAMLAAIVNSPNFYTPTGTETQRTALLHRYQYVLSGMVKDGKLDAATADRIRDRLPAVAKERVDNQYGGQRGFMLTMVKKELEGLGFSDEQIDGGGLRVTTTLDKNTMKSIEDGINAQKPQGLKALHVAAASVDVKSGALKGFYAGQDYLKSQLNWATLGDSPGSAFKPFALAAGLEAGFSLKDTFQGTSPYRFPGGGTVKNEGQGDGHSYGAKINLIKATQESVNTAYVDLTMEMPDGPAKVKRTAIKMGIPSDTAGLNPDATIALGSATVNPINMANGYATIANRGMEHPWYLISKVTDPHGRTLYQHGRKQTRAISSDIADDVSYALQQTVQGGTGQNARALGRPAAGKTGTATRADGQVITSWFVGYTPQLSTAVMYVRGNGRQSLEGYLNPFYGATYPTRTWTSIMQGAVANLPVEQFPPPAYVDGTAPASGHAPLPTYQPKPSRKPKPSNTPSPSRTPSTPTTPSTPPTPSGSPSPTGPPTGGTGGTGGPGNGNGGGNGNASCGSVLCLRDRGPDHA
jgi:membrane peptidoglycan carboxypeptidase